MNESLLRGNGWNQEEITQATNVFQPENKPQKVRMLDAAIYWVVLGVALIGNFIIALVLIPFLITIHGAPLYAVIFIIACAFGAFFDLLIRDIERIQRKKVIIAGLFLPFVALVTVMVITNLSNQMQYALRLDGAYQSPIIISIVYVASFMLPYVLKSSLLLSSRVGRQQAL